MAEGDETPCSLPDSVATEVDLVSEEEVELPESVDEEEDDTVYSKNCKCKLRCYKQFTSKEIVEARQAWVCSETETERKKKLFQAVTLEVKSVANQGSKKIKWTHKGKDVCRQFWAFLNSTSPNLIDLYKKHVSEGGTEPPLNLPKMPAPKAKSQSMKADSWFLSLYDSLAEPYPTENAEEVKMEDLHELVESPSHPLWILSAGLDFDTSAPEKRYVPIRFLNPGNFETIWSQYQAEVDSELQVSKSTLFKAAWAFKANLLLLHHLPSLINPSGASLLAMPQSFLALHSCSSCSFSSYITLPLSFVIALLPAPSLSTALWGQGEAEGNDDEEE